MSGNTTSTGLRSGQGDSHAAFLSAVAIVFFVAGSFLGNLLSQSRLRHSHRIMFGLIASEIATVAGFQSSGLRNVYLEIALLCLAMGMTNPALSKIGAESVSLTFVTGTLSRIGGHLEMTFALVKEQAVGAVLGSVAVARDVTERIEQQRIGARRERLEGL